MTAGRPPKFNTPEEMQHCIDLYFFTCKARQDGMRIDDVGLTDEDWKVINSVADTYPTVTGLGLALDMTRQTLIQYQENDKFTDTVKKAKQRVENAIEQRLFHNNATGSIFNLKNNFDWRDKSESETYGKDGGAIKQDVTVRYVDGKDE